MWILSSQELASEDIYIRESKSCFTAGEEMQNQSSVRASSVVLISLHTFFCIYMGLSWSWFISKRIWILIKQLPSSVLNVLGTTLLPSHLEAQPLFIQWHCLTHSLLGDPGLAIKKKKKTQPNYGNRLLLSNGLITQEMYLLALALRNITTFIIRSISAIEHRTSANKEWYLLLSGY